METLERIGQGESTTFVLPQELSSLLGRYGKQLTGSDVQEQAGLDSLEFDEETRAMLGLDDIDEILGQIDEAAEMDVEQMEKEAEAIKAGNVDADIKSAEEVVAEADEGSAMSEEEEVVTEVDTDGGAPSATDEDDDEEMEFDTNLES